ncbi:baseplate protein [Neisseria sp. HMSC071C03]|nr:baseplate protein [Neisseria sp. HMSC071B12]OHR51447.1 baseplate protein [Neisseria sp. HMSC071C03]
MAEIDLTRLPAPKVIEELDFETIFERKKNALLELVPSSVRETIAATLSLESEPLTIDLQQQAYQEMILRQRINQAAVSTLLAFAQGSDLDHLAAAKGITRKIVRQADLTALPPVEALYETDDDLRRRVQLYPEKLAAAGPRAAYEAHALDAHPKIIDARAVREVAGTVCVFIKAADGVPSAEILQAAQDYLSAETRRPLCDTVKVKAGRPKAVRIAARIRYESGPDLTLVKNKQLDDLKKMLEKNSRLGASVALSKIIGALDTDGVKKIEMASPLEDINCSDGEYISISEISLENMT